MKLVNKIILLIASICLIACEETITDVNLPYSELIVLQAELKADQPIKDILISRTLPPLEKYSFDIALITNAKAYLELNNVKYNLKYNSLDESYYCEDIIPKAGDRFKINIDWNGHNTYAYTTIPNQIDNVSNIKVDTNEIVYKYGYYYRKVLITARVKSNFNVVIYSGFIRNVNDYIYTYQVRKLNSGFNSDMILFEDNSNYLNWEWPSIIIATYDLDFFDYFNTRYEGEQSSDLFSSSGNNIRWNMKGDGIGLFIGSNQKIIPLSN